MLTANWLRSSLSLVPALTILLWSPLARADDPLPDVAQMVRELRYEAALDRIGELRANPSTAATVRLRAVELEALAHLGLGAEERAREAFTRLLTLDPGYSLTDQRPSPRIFEIFQGVRQSLGSAPPRGGLVVAVAAPALDGSPAAVTARPDGEHAVVRVVLRAEVDGRTTDVEAGRQGPPWRAEIPVVDRAAALRLEVVARGFAPSGQLSAVSPVGRAPTSASDDEETDDAEVDDPDGPITETSHGDDDGGLAGKWWFWTAVGAVVIGGAATAIVLGSGGTDPARGGDLGDVTLR